MLVDVVILSNTKDDRFFDLTRECILSYLKDGGSYINKIILVETNPLWDLETFKLLDDKIITLCPNIPFNYNRYLNKALKNCNAELICLSNNDVKVQPGCIENIIKAFKEDINLMSASPIDRTWHRNTYKDFPSDNEIYYGYETTKYILGFNIYLRREVYNIIGSHDERFDFYYQDNDYEMSLKMNKLKHGLVSSARIIHGQDKPDSNDNNTEVYTKLELDKKTFINKWSKSTFNSSYKKYVKLGIIGCLQDKINISDVEFFISDQHTDHCHYKFYCNMECTERLINNIINTIDRSSADKIIIDDNNYVVINK